MPLFHTTSPRAICAALGLSSLGETLAAIGHAATWGSIVAFACMFDPADSGAHARAAEIVEDSGYLDWLMIALVAGGIAYLTWWIGGATGALFGTLRDIGAVAHSRPGATDEEILAEWIGGDIDAEFDRHQRHARVTAGMTVAGFERAWLAEMFPGLFEGAR